MPGEPADVCAFVLPGLGHYHPIASVLLGLPHRTAAVAAQVDIDSPLAGRVGEDGFAFHRWPADTLGPCPQPLHGQVSLITTQSASHSSFPFRRNGKGYGFTWLLLDEAMPQVSFMRFHGAIAERCPRDPLPTAMF